MKPLLAGALSLLLASCGRAVDTRIVGEPGDAQQDRAQIRAVWDHASHAVCTGNWPEYEDVWAHGPEIELMHPGEREWLVGWDAIGPKYRALLTSGFRCEAITREMRIRVAPSREMAWATVEVELRMSGQSAVTSWQTAVFERREGRWRLVHGHASVPPAQ